MGRQHALKVTPSGTDTLDFRHLVTGPRRLEWVAATLAAYLRQMPGRRATWLARLEVLRPQYAPAEPLSYGGYAATVGEVLLDSQLGVCPQRLFASDLAECAAFRDALLGGFGGFIRAFNRSIARLHDLDVATAVAPLADDYLPLFHACPVDGQRVRLRRQVAGRSSVLYLLVKSAAMAEALGLRPIPVLAPESLAALAPNATGLLQRSIMG